MNFLINKNISRMKNEIGLYRSSFEHDNCGIGFVAHLKGKKSHSIVQMGLEVLENMSHRGAEGADNKSGDGAGILLQIPRDFYLIQGFDIPPEGQFGTGIIFLPQDKVEADECLNILITLLVKENINVIGFREVPRDNSILGESALKSEPVMKQILLGADMEQNELERKLFLVRKRAENKVRESSFKQKRFYYIPSLSTKVLIYKGMLTSEQLRDYFLDLEDKRLQSGLALVHSRFSTNTFPSWDLAQPFRMLAHNGEINTIKGNRFWMQARESLLNSKVLGDLSDVFPIVEPNKSDSASLDNVLEFLVMSGKSIPQALSILIPESWNMKNPISPALHAYYEYYSTIMEPWDGPASLIVSDGRFIGGTLDRNGLRPSRYIITNDDLMIMGSEVGVKSFDAPKIRAKGRLRPGKMLFVDTLEGGIHYDDELKAQLAQQNPYQKWLDNNLVNLEDIETGQHMSGSLNGEHELYTKVFNYSDEDINLLLKPMASTGKEPTSSMGNDAPPAAISEKPQRLFNYFKQLFAQVTNPPIDPIREEMVMSLTGYIGSLQQNILEEVPVHCKMVKFTSPVINNTYANIVKNLKYKGFSNVIIPIHFNPSEGENALMHALDGICSLAEKAVDDGHNYIILSDRGIDINSVPVPSLLAVSAVHHHLINKRKRMQIDIVMETAEAREVHHFALLFGYGASVINPYLAFSVIEKLVKDKAIQQDYAKAEQNYIDAVNKGLLKILSKMGISTLRSYRASQIFEAIGIDRKVVDKYFEGTVSRIGGMDLSDIAREAVVPHKKAFNKSEFDKPLFEGFYAYRKDGEHHAWNPESISLLQWSTKTNNYSKFKEYTKTVDDQNAKPSLLRGFFDLPSNPIDIHEVESVKSITRRFVSGAMSYGSISREAHETMAMAMNILGGRSNTGEGGEDPERFNLREDGMSARSAIKQVASGRFGVNAHYLVNADEIQIKIAQGAKPGEGGQLPGHKVDEIIAKTRYSIPGITLISPPPHHDIYSIEDLAQLIFDLKNVNPKAKVSVKLVSETGVGTIAAGVAKAKADLITISGYEGGTGASPSSSIKHAGLPLELGLSETQQTLVMNNLRKNVVLQADGQLKTGKDVIFSALLGAEEFGFATSALIVMGCVMMRKCHLNTCPVGVATQNPELRKRFYGKVDYLVNYFQFIAQEVREYLAQMGFKTLEEIVGRSDLIIQRKFKENSKPGKIDLSAILFTPAESKIFPIHFTTPQDHKIESLLDHDLINLSEKALSTKEIVSINRPIKNTDRATGAMLSGQISMKYGAVGLPEGTINCEFTGSAGQSFGAFLVKGVQFKLFGDSNDYLGKGLSGGRIIVSPPEGTTFLPEENIIIGNTVLYGATDGEVFINGVAGERFCVRNSGATAVVEGVGDHACEYMTGGLTVVLGKTGKNFAAGMSGGVAYVLNSEGNFDYYCNMGTVELSLVESRSDIKELKAIIEKHALLTGSVQAKRILENWEMYIDKFIKVIPFEYKRVLEERKLEELKRKIDAMETDVEIKTI
jgi:glutamate synthase (NADPH/NADH) large chain